MEDVRIEARELERFTCQVIRAAGGSGDQVAAVAEVLVWCDAVGRTTQGVIRLPVFTRRLQEGVLRCPCQPRFVRHGASLGLLHGDSGFGQYAARLAMERALELAADSGVGVVGVSGSNNFGAGAYYVNQAASAGMLGLALSNSFPKVAAHGGVAPVLGTNPLAFGAPRPDGRHLLLDMSTSAAAGSTIRRAAERGEPLPPGLAIDRQGKPITDPAAVKAGAMLPLGGAKGFGLGLMVEVLGAVLTGAGMGRQVRSMFTDFSGNGDNGHLLVAVNIGRLLPLEQFHRRLDELLAQTMASGPPGAVRAPGEARWQALQRSRQEGVQLDGTTSRSLQDLARRLGVSAPW